MNLRQTPLSLLATLMFAVAACGTSVDSTAEPAAAGALASTISSPVATGSLFDASSVHEIAIEIDDAEFTDMLATYVAVGDKEWIEATVTIDGTAYENVGLRLKGNSSLRAVTTEASAEELPWLIRLDKFVDDQNHEGYTDLVVRSNTSETALNEAVALELLGEAGLATEQATSVAFTANGSSAVLRLVIEHPDDTWMAATFEDDGALYKSESTGDWSYRGDDPDAYDEVFDQEAGKDTTDLTPLMDFLDFLENSDDATFASELPERLDIDAFARYLAMMELLDNFDDIDGPGNNSYLYYDIEAEQFTVVPWDLNLAFGATNGAGGPGVGGGGVGGPGDTAGQPPADAVRPNGVGAAPLGAERGGQNQSNVLVERFMANDDFAALYAAALSDLDEELFASGRADAILESWTTMLETEPQLIDAEVVAADAATIRQNMA